MAIGVWLGSHATGADVSLSDASYVEVLEFDMGYGDVSEKEATGTLRLRIRGTKAQVVGDIGDFMSFLDAHLLQGLDIAEQCMQGHP